MPHPRTARAMLVAGALVMAAGCNRPETLTAEAASDRGDALLRQMSQTLARTQAFTYTAEHHRQRVRPDGTKADENFTRDISVRRPNAITIVDKGGHDAQAWYDGKALTLVSHRNKAWARGPMPPTIDQALDFVSEEYAMQVPTADLLYSSAYDALMTKDTTGGWVGVEKVGDTSCDRLSYKQPVVDWDIWLMQDDRRLPRQMTITYKTEPGRPVTRVVFSDWNPSASVTDETFTAKVPEGYERLKIMRHATVEDPRLTDAAPAPAADPKGRKPSR